MRKCNELKIIFIIIILYSEYNTYVIFMTIMKVKFINMYAHISVFVIHAYVI